MILLCFIQILLITPWAQALSVETVRPTLIVLAVGDTKNIPLTGPATVRVSHGKIVRVLTQNPRMISIIGKQPGQALISGTRHVYRIEVVSNQVAEGFKAFETLMHSMQGLTLDIHDNQIFVRGSLWRWSDWEALAKIYLSPDCYWKFAAEIPADLQKSALSHLQQLAVKVHLPQPPSLSLKPYPWVQISPSSPYFSELRQLYKNYGVDVQSDPNSLLPLPSVRLTLTFVELQNGTSSQIGFTWQDGQDVQLLPRVQGPQDLRIQLNYLSSQGQARILAHPTLMARSGSEAEFLAGGEFGIRTGTPLKKDVTWKRHGLWLKFKPELDRERHVRLSLETELSLPDYASAVDGIPSLRTTKTQTHLDMKVGSTLILTELVRLWKGWGQSGVSGILDVPILGSLFRSQNFIQQKSQLVVFVTTELIPIEFTESPKMPEEGSHD